MRFSQRADCHWCICSGRVLFLDVAEDRYFSLPNKVERAFLRLASGDGDLRAEDLQPLFIQGLLVEDACGSGLNAPPDIEPPLCDVSRTGMRPAAGSVLGAIVIELAISLQLRFGSLRQVLHHAARPRPRSAASAVDTDHRLSQIAAASAAAALLLRSIDRCLVRALAVFSRCRSRGIPANLVFGVRMNPFGAHCWVQHGCKVVVGDFEQARLYTPILVLR